MLDENKNIVTALESATDLPVYFELAVDSTNAEMPCVTYRQAGDTQAETGDTLVYSRVRFYVKVWGYSMADMMPEMQAIDEELRGLGYVRDSYNVLTMDSTICLIGLYEGLGLEEATISTP